MCSELPLVADRLPGHSVSINSAQNTDTLLVCKDFSGPEVAQSSSTKQFAPYVACHEHRVLHYIQVCCTRLSHYLLSGPRDSGRRRPANDNAIGIFSVKPATGVASAACLASCRVARPMLPIRFPPASVCRFSTDTKI
jgi:hypothetical protein